eukprot:TRINITY_DN91194_c0_g1_i1.p1 TRINITY_DN91194_c0_g1~~TRINITY_DN91194_c0_g1_i1.p1  ORF type:complete len:287 (-),score=10.18 TRINITY_DN91194_c0_g1_i1:113-901(-)
MLPNQPRIISSNAGGYTMGSSVARPVTVISAAPISSGPAVYRSTASAAMPQQATVLRSNAPTVATSSPIVYNLQLGTVRNPTMQTSPTMIPTQVINAGPSRIIQSPTTVTSPAARYSPHDCYITRYSTDGYMTGCHVNSKSVKDTSSGNMIMNARGGYMDLGGDFAWTLKVQPGNAPPEESEKKSGAELQALLQRLPGYGRPDVREKLTARQWEELKSLLDKDKLYFLSRSETNVGGDKYTYDIKIFASGHTITIEGRYYLG